MAKSWIVDTKSIFMLLLLAALSCIGVVQGLNCYQCGQYNDGVGSITPCINYTATQLKECPKTSEYCIKYVSEGSTVRDCVPTCVEKEPARYFLKFFAPKVIFAHEGAVDVLLEAIELESASTRVIVYGKHDGCQSLQDILRESTSKEEIDTFAPRRADPDDTAFIVLSSGSTGNPKGIQHSYGRVLKMIVTFGFSPFDGVSMWYSTPLWITYIGFLCRCLFSSGTRIIHASFHLEETCRVIEKYKVEVVFLTPTQITMLCKSDVLQKYDLTSVRRVLVGGSKMHEGIFMDFKNRVPRANVLQVYGMSEVGCCTGQLKSTKNSSSIGYLVDSLQMKIKDLESGESLGPNKSGEICFKSTSLMTGYYKNPEATKNTFDEDEAWSTRTYCCKEDGCNGAPTTTTSLGLGSCLLLTLLVAALPAATTARPLHG